MSTAREAALKAVESALESAVSRLCGTYEACLIGAGGNAVKEAECKAIRDTSLRFAKRTHADMLEAVNQQWPPGS
jgi:hypothetical protein